MSLIHQLPTADKTTNGYPTSAGEFNRASKKVTPMTITPNLPGQVMGTVVSPNTTTTLDLRSPPVANLKASPTDVPQLSPAMTNEAWAQVYNFHLNHLPCSFPIYEVPDFLYVSE